MPGRGRKSQNYIRANFGKFFLMDARNDLVLCGRAGTNGQELEIEKHSNFMFQYSNLQEQSNGAALNPFTTSAAPSRSIDYRPSQRVLQNDSQAEEEYLSAAEIFLREKKLFLRERELFLKERQQFLVEKEIFHREKSCCCNRRMLLLTLLYFKLARFEFS